MMNLKSYLSVGGYNLVIVMWANEQFDPKHPDTFFEKVEEK